MPAKWNPWCCLEHEGCPLNTITPHLALATIHAARHLDHVRSLAAAQRAASATGGITLVVVVLIVAVLAGLSRAARSLAALASEFLRVAAELTSAFFIMMVVVAVAVVLLIHP
jgi:hypothetical protein